ncbi:hypothetical protein [Aporhodopirellula aestuarii]|uniref:hypothetical protein n=1 Tax=Aporhodopirellula aestuarii TaxID=2950107 RepID=UPI0020332304|nr:hypothetical protein [Aporhodopirellula aestuarii]
MNFLQWWHRLGHSLSQSTGMVAMSSREGDRCSDNELSMIRRMIDEIERREGQVNPPLPMRDRAC